MLCRTEQVSNEASFLSYPIYLSISPFGMAYVFWYIYVINACLIPFLGIFFVIRVSFYIVMMFPNIVAASFTKPDSSSICSVASIFVMT
uniref:Uncharacterized protein n=1 Tax=Lepeophtheirus salmonis TaxID=72036 RepID=A0A0K2UUB5_LEPSM